MRCFTRWGRTAVLGLVAGLASAPALAAAEDFPLYRVGSEKSAASPAKNSEVPDFDLAFPAGQLPMMGRVVEERAPGEPSAFLRSSRRSRTFQLWPQAQGEPNLFAPDEDRPLKPLAGQWTENPLWQADYADTWGTHPATPAPVPSPRYGMRVNDPNIIPVAGESPVKTACSDGEKCPKCGKCESCKCGNCPGKDCQAGESQLDQGETAKVILELMETLGKSVLDGTVFQKPDQADQEWLKELSAEGQVSPRKALIQYIRHLEAQQERSRQSLAAAKADVEEDEFEVELVVHPLARIKGACQCPGQECECPGLCRECPANCAECRDCPSEEGVCAEFAVHPPRLQDEPGSEVEVLREMSAHLDMAANELERREIYQRADQLRDVATQLRQDARRSSLARANRKHGTVFFSRERYPLAPPQADVHVQLEELRQELKRTQAQLEQARSPRR